MLSYCCAPRVLGTYVLLGTRTKDVRSLGLSLRKPIRFPHRCKWRKGVGTTRLPFDHITQNSRQELDVYMDEYILGVRV